MTGKGGPKQAAKGKKYIKSGESLSSGLWLVLKAERKLFFVIGHRTGSLLQSVGTTAEDVQDGLQKLERAQYHSDDIAEVFVGRQSKIFPSRDP